MTAPADPLLETIAKALHDDGCDAPFEDCVVDHKGTAQRVYDRLLSDAGSTQWGVRENGEVRVMNDEELARGLASHLTELGYDAKAVFAQVLELHGDWEETL